MLRLLKDEHGDSLGCPQPSYKVAVISGGFDPLHSGHLSLIKNAFSIGRVVVGLNSDEWLIRKKGYCFMPWEERAAVLLAMNLVAEVHDFDDSDDTAISLLNKVKDIHSNTGIVFCNGGDRSEDNIPEGVVDGIEFAFDVGGGKVASSSSFVDDVHFQPKTKRWGTYQVLYSDSTTKIKMIRVKPGSCLSYQKHSQRNETWIVKSGHGKVITNHESDDINHTLDVVSKLKPHYDYNIRKGAWHQLINDSRDQDLVILELQTGEQVLESDIASEGYK